MYRVDESRRGRTLTLLARAGDIEEGHLPEAWREVPLVLLCPVAGEVDPGLAAAFDAGVGRGLAAGVDAGARPRTGSSRREPWEDADLVLPHAHSVVVSEEDVEPFEKDVLEWFDRVPVGRRHARRRAARPSSSTASRITSSPTRRPRWTDGRRRRLRHGAPHRVRARGQSLGRRGRGGLRGGDVGRGAGRGRAFPIGRPWTPGCARYRRRQAGG